LFDKQDVLRVCEHAAGSAARCVRHLSQTFFYQKLGHNALWLWF